MSFFKLLTQETEDKIIERKQRIYADILKVNPYDDTEYFSIKTTSFAHKQKIKFFLDAVSTEDPEQSGQFLHYRVGKYYELEHMESAQVKTSLGYFNFAFECEDNNDGTFIWKFTNTREEESTRPILAILDERKYFLHISNIVFEDSFYNPEKGWLNPDNPSNILGKIIKEVNAVEMTEERLTNLKFEGKKVYSKSFKGVNTTDCITTGTNARHTVAILDNMQTIVDISCNIKSNNITYSLPLIYVNTPINQYYFLYDTLTKKIDINNAHVLWNRATYIINILYTKD